MSSAHGLTDVIAKADALAVAGRSFSPTPFATGLDPLDEYLSGGVRSGELVLIGGPQGVGKTTFALQMARHVAASGGVALYLCYEHDERLLMRKLIALEAGLLAGDDAPTLQQIVAILEVSAATPDGMLGRLRSLPAAAEALQRIMTYGDRLQLAKASGRSTGLTEIRDLAAGLSSRGVVFVDYLQKVSTRGMDSLGEDERVTVIVEGLKDAAMDMGVPVVAVAAADKSGIGEGRTRLHHLRGSTALAYECDIALMLNDKWHVVARHHLMYDSVNAERFHDWVVCTIDKNRSGKADVDLEFRKRFAQSRFEAAGALVREELIDDRVFRE